MRRNIMAILYCGTYFLACLGVAGCQSGKLADKNEMLAAGYVGTEVSASGTSVQNKSLSQGEEISLEGFEPVQFCYNPVDNLPVMISRKEHVYSVYERKNTYTWEKKVSYSCGEKEELDTFVYGTDGALYCVRKQYGKDKRYRNKILIRQNLMRGYKDGTLKEITLKNLGIEEIQDVRFEGTALAITCADKSVRFYNIEERFALGSDKIRGEAGNNVFYDFCYFTVKSSSAGEPLIVDYDIRTGEKVKTFSLGNKSMSTHQVHLTNYHEDLYIMTENGLYAGNYTDNTFYRQVKKEEMGISDLTSVCFLQAARDNTLYYAWTDASSRIHFAQINIPEKSKDSVFIEAKL